MSKSKSIVWPIVVLACVLATGSATRGTTTYEGLLTWDAAELVATDGWAVSGTQIAWKITGEGASWDYKYTICFGSEESPALGGLSHIIIGTTPDVFTINSLTNVTFDGVLLLEEELEDQVEVGLHPRGGPDDLPNPNMPEDIWGVKFSDFVDDGCVVVEFHSPHQPVFQDVFGKDGTHDMDPEDEVPKEWATFWNAGFDTPNPTDPAWTGTPGPPPGGNNYYFHILGPDSVIPEPLTVLGMLMGLGSVGAYIRKRRMA